MTILEQALPSSPIIPGIPKLSPKKIELPKKEKIIQFKEMEDLPKIKHPTFNSILQDIVSHE